MRRALVLSFAVLGIAACGGKKPPPVDASSPPPAEDTAKAAEDAAAKPEDAAAKPEDAAAAPADAATAADAGAAPADAAAAAGDAAAGDVAVAVGDAAAAEGGAPAMSPEVARGAYVAGIAGCPLCHTAFGPTGPMMDKMWAGGLEIPEAFGTWRSPNITQDKKTGIGGWTDQEIINAIREGKRPDGTRLYPIMPYAFYNAMSDGDAKALVAYLRTIPPIENAVAGNTDLKMPKMEVPPAKGEEMPTEPVRKGEYLSTMMHCGACHTPFGEQGMDVSKLFGGSLQAFEVPMFGEGKLYGANISPHPTAGIGGWSDADIEKALREGVRKDGTPIYGPMEMYRMAWSKMPAEDMGALIAYVRSVPPVDQVVPKSTFRPKGPPDAPPADGDAAPPAPDKGDAKP